MFILSFDIVRKNIFILLLIIIDIVAVKSSKIIFFIARKFSFAEQTLHLRESFGAKIIRHFVLHVQRLLLTTP